MNENIKILVADDEIIIRNLFKDILEEEGYEVVTVINGKEAEEKVKETFFNIAFIDVHMPVMNGLETVRMLKKLSPKTIIVMTDSFPDQLYEEIKKEGNINCIQKPFNIAEVKIIIRKITKENS